MIYLPPDQLVTALKRLRDDVSACPHPNKRRYKTQCYAEQRALCLNMSAYLCVCGYWHLTSQGSKQNVNSL